MGYAHVGPAGAIRASAQNWFPLTSAPGQARPDQTRLDQTWRARSSEPGALMELPSLLAGWLAHVLVSIRALENNRPRSRSWPQQKLLG